MPSWQDALRRYLEVVRARVGTVCSDVCPVGDEAHASIGIGAPALRRTNRIASRRRTADIGRPRLPEELRLSLRRRHRGQRAHVRVQRLGHPDDGAVDFGLASLIIGTAQLVMIPMLFGMHASTSRAVAASSAPGPIMGSALLLTGLLIPAVAAVAAAFYGHDSRGSRGCPRRLCSPACRSRRALVLQTVTQAMLAGLRRFREFSRYNIWSAVIYAALMAPALIERRDMGGLAVRGGHRRPLAGPRGLLPRSAVEGTAASDARRAANARALRRGVHGRQHRLLLRPRRPRQPDAERLSRGGRSRPATAPTSRRSTSSPPG